VTAMAPQLARTASDPAPPAMSLDATTLMAPISLGSSPGSRRRGLPPVPPSASRPGAPPSRPTTAGTPADVAAPPAPASRALATVTRLPVARRTAGDDLPEASGSDTAVTPVPAVADAPVLKLVAASSGSAEIISRLTDLGVPQELLRGDVAARIDADGTYAALTRALAAELPETPVLPGAAGDVVFVVGPGVETLLAARALSTALRLDPDRVQWATRGDLAGLAPEDSRITTTNAATGRRRKTSTAGTVTIVAVDAPLRGDAPWVTQMLNIWSPVAVWAVVEATRKPDDLELWLDGLARVDALIVQDTDLSTDPAAVLRLPVPVALVDGARATPHRWASLLCERLDSSPA
jgi:hypothetical protein